ncbi:MAG: hypothetical protein JNL01_01620 [Bdellovibrionales bacterium]|nr:hypothetical protein [Bdellovibrionales bacterium]
MSISRMFAVLLLGVTVAGAFSMKASADDAKAEETQSSAESEAKDRTIAAEAGVSPETDRYMKEAGGQVERIFQQDKNSAKDPSR